MAARGIGKNQDCAANSQGIEGHRNEPPELRGPECRPEAECVPDRQAGKRRTQHGQDDNKDGSSPGAEDQNYGQGQREGRCQERCARTERLQAMGNLDGAAEVPGRTQQGPDGKYDDPEAATLAKLGTLTAVA